MNSCSAQPIESVGGNKRSALSAHTKTIRASSSRWYSYLRAIALFGFRSRVLRESTNLEKTARCPTEMGTSLLLPRAVSLLLYPFVLRLRRTLAFCMPICLDVDFLWSTVM